MKLRRWTGALAAALVLSACSGDGDVSTEGATGDSGQVAEDAGGQAAPATPVEQVRDMVHEADPGLCGTTGEEDPTQRDTEPSTASPQDHIGSINTGECRILAWDPAEADFADVEDRLGSLNDSSAVRNDEDGWLILGDEQTDPRPVVEQLGGEIHSWPAADPDMAEPDNTIRTIRNFNDPVDRCEDTTDEDPRYIAQREENRSVSYDNGGCLIYVWSPMLTEAELEELQQDAITTAEAEDAALLWGSDRYVMSRDTNARSMRSAIGFEILVG